MTHAIEAEIRAFIDENFLFRSDQDAIDAGASLLETGLIDSMSVLELVTFLEGRFGITVTDAEMMPENLDTIAALTAFVARKTSLATAA
ncbi:MAG: acyl carrier protein [Methylobacterium frigidaeris]